jgi:hypothetical protein
MTIKIAAATALTCAALGAASAASADGYVQAQTPAVQAPSAAQTPAASTSGRAPKLTAKLVDAEGKAKKQAATVEVKVSGLQLVDPASAGEMPKAGQGHLHYKVDGGPVIATTAPKLSFHDLKSGPHSITVILAGNDHAPLGPSETLSVTVP